MSATITDAHRNLARLLTWAGASQEQIEQHAQAIADSEAKALSVVCGRHNALIAERDQLKAEVETHNAREACIICKRDVHPSLVESGECVFCTLAARSAEVMRLQNQIDNLLKPMRDEANARAERAEASAASLLDENVKLNGYADMEMKARARAEKAEAELAKERARLEQAIVNEPEFPGDCPPEVMTAIRMILERDGDAGIVKIMRLAVRLTKASISERLYAGKNTPTPLTDAIDEASAQARVMNEYRLRAEKAEAELATEWARLDWVDARGFAHKHHETGDHLANEWCITSCSDDPDKNIRAAIDAAMQEGKV